MSASESSWRDYHSVADVEAVPRFGNIPLYDVRRREVTSGVLQ